jgi:hypothetical protein
MEYITSRSFSLPETESEMAGHWGSNMWRSKLGPYTTLAVGDTLYWYETVVPQRHPKCKQLKTVAACERLSAGQILGRIS